MCKASAYYSILFMLMLVCKGMNSFANDTTHFVSTWKTSNPGLSDVNSVTIATDERYDYLFDIDWDDDGIFDDLGVSHTITHRYSEPGEYSIRIRGKFPRMAFEETPLFPFGDRYKLMAIDQWGTNEWEDMSYAFFFCENLTVYAEDVPNLSRVTDLSYLFANSSYFTGDLSRWDVSTITNMEGMFMNAKVFNSELNDWDVSSVTNMKSMFQGATIFNQNLNNWDVTSVVDMSYMFKGATSFNGNIGDWNVYYVENMSGIFLNAAAFDQSLNFWDISSTTNINYMYGSPFGYSLFSIFLEALIYGFISF